MSKKQARGKVTTFPDHVIDLYRIKAMVVQHDYWTQLDHYAPMFILTRSTDCGNIGLLRTAASAEQLEGMAEEGDETVL